MRIQHNISAMNSYRNFSANNSKISKNLEKLSTGYAINRAGDDAAGLAISEKMRAQISGLEGATKNAKDGISLIQTAEGALTEVHDMLNRMTTLAEQSANGTYQDELDREQLQKEVESLKTEIDRIADSTNFNGLKLLDGSLSSTGRNGISADLSKLGVDVLSSAKTISAQKGTATTANLIGGSASTATVATEDGKTQFSITLNFTDADGNEQSVTESFYVKTNGTANASAKLMREDGTDEGAALTYEYKTGTADQIREDNIAEAFKEILNKNATVKSSFTVDLGKDGGLKFESKQPGSSGAVLNGYSVTKVNDRTDEASVKTTYATEITKNPLAEDAIEVYDLSKAKIWKNSTGEVSSAGATIATRDLEDAVFEVNGEKFVFVNSTLTDTDIKKLTDAGIKNWVQIGTSTAEPTSAPSSEKVKEMADKIAQATGLTVQTGHITQDATGTNKVDGKTVTLATGAWDYVDGLDTPASGTTNNDVFVRFIDSEGTTAGGLSLQIGDTSDSYNKLTVSVGDMHSKMIGVGDVDISSQKGAAEALDKIKQAVNTVSDTRGTLGALQNRLDHTLNNLGVMRENIQNAESNIRDTDVAEEMMNYTKNNILNQSAQAMLAQANQLPQGVLQLLG